MIPTAVRLSKASRAPLTPKRGNKDFYKGTRQAFLPGSRRTGAPGQHVVRGKAKYRLLDEKVRVYVAPSIDELNSSPLKPYVAMGTKLTPDQESAVFSKFRKVGGLTPEHFLRVSREYAYALENPEAPTTNVAAQPAWLAARIRLGMMPNPYSTDVVVKADRPVASRAGGAWSRAASLFERK
ncbi:hypothetical protein GALMADRAFT_277607 [Galerina marginata CBS 339.88]|uniref:Uncharacterized protein n=1 Tax=Galerina marginata (strain CBS 339.88) TaxID=685588 RepID=A0A067TKN8_GALM3|nr:hypothetical protein GALMADRAFT_277607 [Galerina marginata CBS 339.88]